MLAPAGKGGVGDPSFGRRDERLTGRRRRRGDRSPSLCSQLQTVAGNLIASLLMAS